APSAFAAACKSAKFFWRSASDDDPACFFAAESFESAADLLRLFSMFSAASRSCALSLARCAAWMKPATAAINITNTTMAPPMMATFGIPAADFATGAGEGVACDAALAVALLDAPAIASLRKSRAFFAEGFEPTPAAAPHFVQNFVSPRRGAPHFVQ